MKKVIAMIPARMASTRFPGKPLKPIFGLPMIEHVRRRVNLCDFLDDVIVATCDKEIADEVKYFGGKVVMTLDTHPGCVDRVAEAAKSVNAKIIINVQGDMPLVPPESLKDLVQPLLNEAQVQFVDMMGPIENELEFNSPNVVKVVVDLSGNALYYSREAIPSLKKPHDKSLVTIYKQFGINAFRRKSLDIFANLPQTPLEKAESVDMLRLLENGYKIKMVLTKFDICGVDTPQDLQSVEKLMSRDPLVSTYI